MRILHVTAQKPDSTGSGVYLRQVIQAFEKSGLDQAVVCGINVDDYISLPLEVPVYPVRFNTDGLPFDICGMSDEMPYNSTRYRDLTPKMLAQFEVAFETAIKRALEDFAPDIIICNHLYLVTALVRELADDVPVIAICHNTCLRQLDQHDLEKERILNAIAKLDLVLALHEEQRQRILQKFDLAPDKVQVIGTGYDADTFFKAPGHELRKASKPEINMVYAGKITYKKGVDSLFDAVAKLPCRPGVIHLHLCGGVSNSFQETSLKLSLKQCPQDAQWMGKLSPKDLAGEYRWAQIFVLPSFYEGLPLVVIEAIACGCKVVVTDLPGLREWIEANIPKAPVWYVQPPRMQSVDEPLKRDLPLFAERLAGAIKEAVLAAPGDTDVTHLSWDALGDRLLGFCKQVIGGEAR